MARKAELFERARGSVVRGYILIKQGGKNITPGWYERAYESRKNRQKKVAKVLRKGGVADIPTLEDWELSYQKECFYYGIRALLELERDGTTKL